MSSIEALYLVSTSLLLMAGVGVLVLNPWRNINRCFAILITLAALSQLCIIMAIRTGGAFMSGPPYPAHFWISFSHAFSTYLPWTFFLIKLALLEDLPFARILARSWPWFFISCLLACIAFSKYNIPPESTHESPHRGIGYVLNNIAICVLCIALLIDAYRRMSQIKGVRRLEIKFFLINTCVSTLVITALNMTGHYFNYLLLRHVSPIIVAASSCLAIWALCYHRVFDARQIFAALARRISTLVVLLGGTLGMHTWLAPKLEGPASLLLSVGLAGLLATFWDRWVQLWLGLDAAKVLAQPRAKIIDWARSEPDAGKLKIRFEEFLRDWCQTDFVAFHTREPGKAPVAFLGQTDLVAQLPRLVQTGCLTAESLDRHRPDASSERGRQLMASHQLGALIAAPRGSTSPSSIVALGRKLSLRPYTHPDLQMLLSLVELMDNILMHSHAATHAARIEMMEAAAMMSRGLAHDLNNLATPVSTFLLHMEGRVSPGTAEAEVLADAKHSIQVMQDYIRESLFFARRLVPELSSVNSTDILSTVVRLSQDRATRRGVSVRIQEDAQLAFCADQALIQRLLQNLVANGIDASPAGGTVDLAATAGGPQYLQFTVTDHGSGIPAAIAGRIFEPYFTTKDTGDEVRGLGLGLAICLKIVDLHSGRIEVNTGPGLGTTVVVNLPLDSINPDPAAAGQPAELNVP